VAYRREVRRIRFLLKPGWLILAVVVAGFAYLCFNLLAPWQLGKNSTTEQRNTQINDSFTARAVPLGEIDAAGQEPRSEQEWRRVTVSGTYLSDKQVLARLRTVLGEPAYEVLTPFRVADGPLQGRVVLIDRGYVRPVQGTQPPPVVSAPAGSVQIEARIRVDEEVQSRANFDTGGVQQVYAVNAGAVGAATDLPILPGYLQLAENQAGVLTALPLPQLDAGPYLSYGLQWIAFGIMAPLGLGYFVWAELRERRNSREDAGSPTLPEPEPQPEPEPVPVLADRYGKRR